LPRARGPHLEIDLTCLEDGLAPARAWTTHIDKLSKSVRSLDTRSLCDKRTESVSFSGLPTGYPRACGPHNDSNRIIECHALAPSSPLLLEAAGRCGPRFRASCSLPVLASALCTARCRPRGSHGMDAWTRWRTGPGRPCGVVSLPYE